MKREHFVVDNRWCSDSAAARRCGLIEAMHGMCSLIPELDIPQRHAAAASLKPAGTRQRERERERDSAAARRCGLIEAASHAIGAFVTAGDSAAARRCGLIEAPFRKRRFPINSEIPQRHAAAASLKLCYDGNESFAPWNSAAARRCGLIEAISTETDR